jgi:hypothetical protein
MSTRIRASLSCLVVFLTLAAARPLAAQTSIPACHGAQHPGQVVELLLGRNIGGHFGVTDGVWQRFVARELTPRFPDGLTVTDAIGQWRDPSSGAIVRERTKRVEIVLPGHDDDAAKLDAAVEAYKREFHQRSVGVIVRPACVSF